MMTAEKRKAGLQRSGEVSEEDEGKGIREGTEYEKGRHDQKEEKANKIRYKMVGVACFHCFLCCWKKDRDPSISRKRAEAVRGVDACPGGRRVLKELSMRG